MQQTPLQETVRLGGLIGLPVALGLMALVLFAGLDPLAAIVAGAAVTAALSWLLRREFAAIRHAIDRHRRAGTDAAADPLPIGFPPMASELAGQLERQRRDLAARVTTLEERADAAERLLDNLPEALLVVDDTRRIARANRSALDLLGGDLVGRDLTMAVRDPATLALVEQILTTNRPAEARTVPEPASGRTLRIAGQPVGGDKGGALITLYDVSDQVHAERMRGDFVANASHELKTPLASIIGLVETLTGAARNDAKAQQRFLGMVDEQAKRMARLVEDLLALSHIERDEHRRPTEAVDVVELVRGVIELLEVTARTSDKRIVLDHEGVSPRVVGDRDQLTQVFQNLVDNALKYGGDRSTVAVRVWPTENGKVVVEVCDQGKGIPPEHLPRLTERFYRVDDARSRALGGTGLGLAIVKHVVSRHRGSLAIDSVLGEGTTVRVELPLES